MVQHRTLLYQIKILYTEIFFKIIKKTENLPSLPRLKKKTRIIDILKILISQASTFDLVLIMTVSLNVRKSPTTNINNVDNLVNNCNFENIKRDFVKFTD